MRSMPQNCLAVIALRGSIAAFIVLWTLTSSAPAQRAGPAKPTSIDGVYNGSYTGDKGLMKFKLTITQPDGGGFKGVFTLYLPSGFDTKAYTCDFTGLPPNDRGAFVLVPARGGTPPPAGIDVPGMNGVFDPAGGNGAGQISGQLRGFPAPKFTAIRDATETAKLAAALAAKAPPAGPTGINGAYTGTYNRGGGFPPANLRFLVKATADGSLSALFTFDLPAFPGSSVTYKLTGRYDAGAHDSWGNKTPFQFTTVEPMGNLALDKDPFTHITVDQSRANRVQVEILNPSSIRGSVRGKDPRNGVFTVGSFGGTRDKIEPADLDKVMAAQLRAAANPAAPIATAKPGIEGVFNGTYTKEKGTPTKFKLTIARSQQGVTVRGVVVHLTGMATIYLPTDSGTKAYSYSLKGSGDPGGHDNFSLYPQDWATTPPKDLENRNLKSMGFNGTLVLDPARKTAKIVNINIPKNDKDDIPSFEATWDPTESSDIEGTIAAQKRVDAAELAAALKERDEMVRNAPPKQLASKDLVRKSRKYWDGYQTDMIREVFDGGFGAAIDENQQFQFLFTTYVEMYSAKYAALLPANHERVTITRYSTKPDGNGGYIKVADSTSTVEVDSRFAPKYRQFAEGLGSSSGGMGTAIAAIGSGASPQQMINILLAPKRDMERFFANHDGKSAAMRQLTENFLRGATGEPSLQQADGKIDGAQAESDKDLPPGRYARFVDAANAYFRDRAEKDPAMFGHNSSRDTAFCQRLSEAEQSVMSREEEYYYANDFEGRFYSIMGSRASCPDPAWPRLHPAFEKAVE